MNTIGDFKFTPKTAALINEVLQSGQISYGPMSKRFENDFAKLHDCDFGVLSNSGTSSLLVALETLKEARGWRDGDEVIVPALTFVATVNTVLQARLKPVLVDVEGHYYGIDVSGIKVRKRTRCIIPVHLFGQPCEMNDILYIGYHKNIGIIEDSCETMFVKQRKNDMVGSLSDIACFSTYMAHLITTGVGGIAITNNPHYARLMRSFCNHGMAYDDLSTGKEFNPKKLHRDFTFDRIGYSFRITELEAAIGLAQLDTWQTMTDNRQANARHLTEHLKNLPLQLPAIRPGAEHAFMMYPIICLEGDRDELTGYLNMHHIETRRMLPLINQPAYAGMWKPKNYPVAQWIDDNGFYIGCHQNLTRKDLDYAIEILHNYYRQPA